MQKRKIFILILLAALITHWHTSFSQEKKKIPIPTLFNTGVDDYKFLLDDGDTDPHYLLSSSADYSFPGPDTKIVFSGGFPFGSWINNDNSSKWIAPRADAGDFNAAGMYIYTLTFSLHEFKPETAEIRGFWTTDNNGVDILINASSLHYETAYNSFAFGFFPFEIKQGFIDGFNTISFVVYNGEAPTGLRVVIQGEAEPKDFAVKF
jgi:hypothetical protein